MDLCMRYLWFYRQKWRYMFNLPFLLFASNYRFLEKRKCWFASNKNADSYSCYLLIVNFVFYTSIVEQTEMNAIHLLLACSFHLAFVTDQYELQLSHLKMKAESKLVWFYFLFLRCSYFSLKTLRPYCLKQQSFNIAISWRMLKLFRKIPQSMVYSSKTKVYLIKLQLSQVLSEIFSPAILRDSNSRYYCHIFMFNLCMICSIQDVYNFSAEYLLFFSIVACVFESKWKALSRKVPRKRQNKQIDEASLALLQHRQEALNRVKGSLDCNHLQINWHLNPLWFTVRDFWWRS